MKVKAFATKVLKFSFVSMEENDLHVLTITSEDDYNEEHETEFYLTSNDLFELESVLIDYNDNVG